MGQIYFLIFWIPALAAALMLLVASQSGLLSRPGRLLLWFGAALGIQVFSDLFSPLWVVGLVLQVALGIFLAVKLNIGKWYMWYTTCPKCAKKYGKNYVVIVGQIQ